MARETFGDLLAGAGVSPRAVKLLRHDRRGLDAWAAGRDHFLSFASIQSADHSPFSRDPELVAHFLPGPRLPSGGYVARFVGVSRLHGRWPWDHTRLPRVWLADYRTKGSQAEAADQSWTDVLGDEAGRLDIDWGNAPRAWHQWARVDGKPVIGHGDSEDIARWSQSQGRSSLLDDEALHRETLAQEESAIAGAIAKNAFILDRAFDEFRQALVRQRPDQARFRDLLRLRHGDRCAITGCDAPEALEAAHIIPFSEASKERNFPSNGLLLRRDLHRLFDLLLVSVDPADSTIWLHPRLRSGSFADLHGQSIEADVATAALAEHFRRARGRVVHP